MKATTQVLEKYLEDILDFKIKLSPWNKKRELPIFLNDAYDFFEGDLLERHCLFLFSRVDSKITPAGIKKQIDLIHKKTERFCVLVQQATTSYNRKRLIEHRIPFIIPNSQIYLPFLGIVLQEYFKPANTAKESISPATQVVIINALLSESENPVTPLELSLKLGYSPMTMTRAFNELEKLGIGQVVKKGKERILSFPEGKRTLWEKAKHFMRSPVKKRLWAKGNKLRNEAGLSALASQTMLASPPLPIYAINFKNQKKTGIKELPDQEIAAFELEVWHYDPDLFAQNGRVDPFSLYLSLEEYQDERVESALEDMMEKLEWSEA